MILRKVSSVMIPARLYGGNEVNNRHVVIEESWQWLIGTHITPKCDIVRTKINYQKLSSTTITAVQNVDLHFHLSSYFFLDQANNNCFTFHAMLFCGTGMSKRLTNLPPWSNLQKLLIKFLDMPATTQAEATFKYY